SQGRPGALQELALDVVVRDVARLLQPLMPADIVLSCRCASELPTISGDAVSAQQIVMNLCLNARDAQPRGGQVAVSLSHEVIAEARCASCHQRFGGAFVVLAVSDAGPGIDPQVVARIFDPFFTTKREADTTTTRATLRGSEGGSGLGLSVVHGAIHQMGGHVTVGGADGGGTRFAVYFPCRAACASCEEAASG
ncbi:MAG: ATP-binding protein, partial [Gammaproteobacteria bacterium]